MTIKEIKKRHANGMSLSLGLTPIFEGDELGIPGWEKMDLVERHQMAQQVMRNMRDHRQKQYDEAQKRRDAETKAQIRKEFEELVKASQNASNAKPSTDGGINNP